MGDLIKEIVVGFSLTAIAWIAGLAGRFLMAQLSNIKDARVRAVVDSLVRAAAQKIPDNKDKYYWVANSITKKFKWLRPDDVEALIEAAVFNLKKEIKPPGSSIMNPTGPGEVVKIKESDQSAAVTSIDTAVEGLKSDLAAGSGLQAPTGTITVTDIYGNITTIPAGTKL